jgi:hypothetical protein
MEEYRTSKLLLENGIIEENNSIVNESKFKEFIFGIFLFYLSFERYKSLFDSALESQRRHIIRNQRPIPFALPAFPFRFVGMGSKTLFIGKMDRPTELFPEIINQTFFWNYNYIDRVLPIIEGHLGENCWSKSHSCTKSYLNKYCRDCKTDFSEYACSNLELFSKSLGIQSFIKLDLPSEIFKEHITQGQEGLIEFEQEPHLCECKKRLEKEWVCCPYCRKDIDHSIFEGDLVKSSIAEKIFNEVLAVYFSLKKGYSFKANYVLDKDFSNEVDIYLSKPGSIKLIEFTTKLDVNKDYVISKAKTLNLVEGSLRACNGGHTRTLSCNLILSSINCPSDLDYLKTIPLKIHESGKFKILNSSFRFNANSEIKIEQTELDSMKDAFFGLIHEILKEL